MVYKLCECKFHELSLANVNVMWPEHSKCNFYELSFAYLNLMRAELCKCKFFWELSIANVNFMSPSWALQMCIVESWAFWMWIYESWAIGMHISWDLSFANINCNCMRPEYCVGEFYELSFACGNLMRAELCNCEFYENCVLQM